MAGHHELQPPAVAFTCFPSFLLSSVMLHQMIHRHRSLLICKCRKWTCRVSLAHLSFSSRECILPSSPRGYSKAQRKRRLSGKSLVSEVVSPAAKQLPLRDRGSQAEMPAGYVQACLRPGQKPSLVCLFSCDALISEQKTLIQVLMRRAAKSLQCGHSRSAHPFFRF